MSAAVLAIVFMVQLLALTLIFSWKLPYTNPLLRVSPAYDFPRPVVVPGLAAEALRLPAPDAVVRRHLADRPAKVTGTAA